MAYLYAIKHGQEILASADDDRRWKILENSDYELETEDDELDDADWVMDEQSKSDESSGSPDILPVPPGIGALGLAPLRLELVVDWDPEEDYWGAPQGGDHRGARRILAELRMLDLCCLHEYALSLWALPLASSSSFGSIPQTFSPQTSVIPEIAVPIAKCSQFLRAISVEPSAPAVIDPKGPG